MVYIRDKVIHYWADLMEKWGHPIVTAAINSMKGAFDAANVGEGYVTEESRMNKLLEQWENMKARNVFLYDRNGDQIEIKDFGAQGNNMFRDYLNYMDSQIHAMILGSELVTETGGGHGSYAMAHVHRGTTQAKIMYIRDNHGS